MRVWLPAIKGGSGADVFTRRLAVALQKRGVDAEITWFATSYQFAPYLLRSVIPPNGTDIIHATSWAGFAFKRKGIPLIVTEHLDVLDPEYRPYKSLIQHVYHENLIRTFVKASFRAAAAITTVSRSTASSLRRILGTRPVQIIHNWVDTRTFRPLKARCSIRRPFRLLFVGNLTRRKGADLLTPIMKRLNEGFELRFTSGLRDLKLSDVGSTMVAIGQLTKDSELVAAYNECDALLFPSRLEGLPLAPLEAMACAKPVIASRTSSLPEVIDDGVTGILCEPNNIDEFTSACRKLADCPEIGRTYGEAARNRVERLFSEDVVIPQYISLYEGLADRKDL